MLSYTPSNQMFVLKATPNLLLSRSPMTPVLLAQFSAFLSTRHTSSVRIIWHSRPFPTPSYTFSIWFLGPHTLWFSSYPVGHFFSLSFTDFSSSLQSLYPGVCQDSVLGPLFFSVNINLSCLMTLNSVIFHDSQISTSSPNLSLEL